MKFETKTRVLIGPYNKSLAIFNECLRFPYSNQDKDKEAVLEIYDIIPARPQILGNCTFELMQNFKKATESRIAIKSKLKINDCQDKNAYIVVEFNINEEKKPQRNSSVTKMDNKNIMDKNHLRKGSVNMSRSANKTTTSKIHYGMNETKNSINQSNDVVYTEIPFSSPNKETKEANLVTKKLYTEVKSRIRQEINSEKTKNDVIYTL